MGELEMTVEVETLLVEVVLDANVEVELIPVTVLVVTLALLDVVELGGYVWSVTVRR